MSQKIKTRQVHKDIKVLDKTAAVTDHIKQSYVRTKETIMQSTETSKDRENNPVGYAEDAASEYADRIFHETGHQVRRQAGKTSIKTSEQTANASVRAMHYSMKKAEKAVQTARQTAQNTKIAVKKTAKAVTHAIKALMEATKALLSALTAGGWIAVVILMIVILFGGFLCMTGGDNSSMVSSVSAEVEAYEPLIRQYANQYGIALIQKVFRIYWDMQRKSYQ